MLEKLGNLLNIKVWLQKFITSQIITKAVKHAVAGIIGLLSSVIFTVKVKPVLDTLGITIDPIHLAEGLTVFFTGLAGSIMNWAIKVMEHEKTETKA